jgi:hypothetical protein
MADALPGERVRVFGRPVVTELDAQDVAGLSES